MPEDLDVLFVVDLEQIRQHRQLAQLSRWWRRLGLSASVWEALHACLSKADKLFAGVRLSQTGFDGDLIVVLSGLESKPDSERLTSGDNKSRGNAVCYADGWNRGEPLENADAYVVYEPKETKRTAAMRDAAVLALASDAGQVVVVTPGQVDSLLRTLKYGPDDERLDTEPKGMVVVRSRLKAEQLPESWTTRAPWLHRLMPGMQAAELEIATPGVRGSTLRVTLTYEESAGARAAGEYLRDIRNDLLGSANAQVARIAELAHASLQGPHLRLEIQLDSIWSSL